MAIFLEGIFPMIFLSYFFYIIYFLFLLIPIFSQILFLHIFKIKDLWKLCIVIFLTEGLIIALSNVILDLYLNISDISINDIPMILSLFLLISILTIISIYICKTPNKINIKKTFCFLSSYSINILILIFMILKFNLFEF